MLAWLGGDWLVWVCWSGTGSVGVGLDVGLLMGMGELVLDWVGMGLLEWDWVGMGELVYFLIW